LSIHMAEIILALEVALGPRKLRLSYDFCAIFAGRIAILITPVIEFPGGEVSLVICGCGNMRLRCDSSDYSLCS
jgi:hypothetical protein